MTFKERAYTCPGCGRQSKALRWDTDPVPPCDRCGAELEETSLAWAPNRGVVDDTVIGGRWCETIGQEPFFYTSKSALRREAERRGYQNVVRHTDEYHARQRKQHDERLRDTKQVRA